MQSHALKDINYHDDIAADYDHTVVAPRIVTNDIVYSKLGRFVRPGNKMLDLGCGTGHLTGRFGRRFRRIVAVDHSAGMLQEAKRKCHDWGLSHAECVQQDALTFLVESHAAQFDFAGCVGFLHHLQPSVIKDTLTHVARVLRPGGVAIIQEPIIIPANSVPAAINKWNSQSVVTRMQYCHSAPPPDEKPLELATLTDCFAAAGLVLRIALRNWEIFPLTLPATLVDRIRIRLMNMRFGRSGNVYSAVLQRPE